MDVLISMLHPSSKIVVVCEVLPAWLGVVPTASRAPDLLLRELLDLEEILFGQLGVGEDPRPRDGVVAVHDASMRELVREAVLDLLDAPETVPELVRVRIGDHLEHVRLAGRRW